MTLRDLLYGVTATPVAAVPVSGISRHSKQVRPGDCFVAIRGASSDGHQFIAEAMARGASAVVAEQLPAELPAQPCPCIVVPDTKQALAVLAAKFYGHPSRKLRLLGVTGTNGKTTTTYLMKHILEASGRRTGMLGTIVYQIGSREIPSSNTTPGPLELQRFFAQMVGEGIEWCAMEASSHALAQGRLEGLELQAAIFSNLGSDHLDYHKTREAYGAAKRRMFDYVGPSGYAVINADDEFGRALAETLPHGAALTYGMDRPAKCTAVDVRCSWQGVTFTLESPWGALPLSAPLLGRHNVSNITAAAAALMALEISPAAVRDGLSSVATVPGRLEQVANETGINILIDYAHTADALRMVLASLRELTRGRLIVMFGCGGNRDKSKRPVMGKVASLLADHVVLTSDNPRSEDPMEIIAQIQGGFAPSFTEFQVVPNREQAIATALQAAKPDDTVLIAGKGHEAYQIFENVSIPFVDKDVVERWLHPKPTVTVS